MNNELWQLTQHFLIASGQAAALIAVVALAAPFVSRWVPARWRIALWALVLVRLLVPVVPQSSFSAYGLMRPSQQPLSVTKQNPVVRSEAIVESRSVRAHEPRPALRSAQTARTPSAIAPAGAAPITTIPWLTLGLIGWLIGAITVAIWHLRDRSRLRRLLRSSSPCTSPRIMHLLDSCRAHMDVTQRIPVVISDSLPSPALVGWRLPRVLLPNNVDALSDQEIRHALLHELTHIKRHDMLLDRCMIVATALHWFNPLVWLMSRRVRADQELACDESVVTTLSASERTDYAKTIVSLCERISQTGAAGPLLAMSANKRLIKRRIIMITRFRPASYLHGAITVVGSTLIALALLTRPTVTSAAEPEVVDANPHRANIAGEIDVTPRKADAEEMRIRSLLDQEVDFDFDKTDMKSVVNALQMKSGINIHIDPAAIAAGAPPVSLHVEHMTLRDVLENICELSEIGYVIENNVLVLGLDRRVQKIQTRYYDLKPLTATLPSPESETVEGQRIVDLIQECVDPDSWGDEGFALNNKGALLISRANQRVNEHVLQFLTMLRDRRSIDPSPAEVANEAVLEKRLNIEFNNQPLQDTVAFLRTTLGINVVVSPQLLQTPQPVTASFRDISVRRFLDWLASESGWRYYFRNGALYLRGYRSEVVRVYNASDLPLKNRPLLALLEDAIPGWENSHSAYWNGLVIILAPGEIQRQAAATIEDFRHLGPRLSAIESPAFGDTITADDIIRAATRPDSAQP
jgi:beta-lactamase regulating signal transducer with metallopeptidase domain